MSQMNTNSVIIFCAFLTNGFT